MSDNTQTDTDVSQTATQETTQLAIKEDGTFRENWAEKYDEADKPTLSRFDGKHFDDFVTSHMALRKKFGHDPETLIQTIKDDSPDDVKEAFWKAAGKPDSVDGYKFEKSKDLSEKVEVAPEQVKAFAAIAHKYHLNNEQFNGAVNEWLALVGKDIDTFDAAMVEKDEQSYNEGMAALKKVFKDGLDQRTARANGLLTKYSDATLLEKLFEESPKLKNSPYMTMFLDNIAETMSEDTLKGATTVTAPTAMQITTKINELKAHPAFLDRTHAQHKDIVAQISELYKKKSA